MKGDYGFDDWKDSDRYLLLAEMLMFMINHWWSHLALISIESFINLKKFELITIENQKEVRTMIILCMKSSKDREIWRLCTFLISIENFEIKDLKIDDNLSSLMDGDSQDL